MTAESTEVRDLDLTGISTAEVATFHGDIVVTAGSEQPRLEVAVHGTAHYSVERLGPLLYINAKKRGLSYAGNRVGFRLWLPAGLKYKLATVSGAVRIQGELRTLHASTVNGEIEVQSAGQAELHLSAVSGSIGARGASGRIKASTVNGGIVLADVDGQIDASSAKGPLEVTNAAGRVSLSTGKGTIQVAGLRGQIQASTGAGVIRFERVTFEPGTVNWAKTGFGAVEVLGFSAPGGMRLRARTHKKPIRADLPTYVIRAGRDSLQAQMTGSRPASLELATSGEITITV